MFKATPLMLAITLHIAIAFGVFIGTSNNTSIVPQSINISFVAPSMQASHNGLAKNTNQSTDKNGINASSKESGKNSITRETSGKEDVNAKDISSAITEAVFDAAYLNNPAPLYPQSAKQDGIQGKVMLIVDVSEHGTAKAVKVVKSSGYNILDNSAISAVSSWKFIPAQRLGRAISSSVIVPIEFKLS